MTDKIWFASEDDIAAIARGVADRTLPRREWTHAAHFAAALELLRRRGLEASAREMPGLIRAYNEAVGTPNTDAEGYHETITQASLRAAHSVLSQFSADTPLHVVGDALMNGAYGNSRWLLTYWTGEALFTVEARRGWVEPDLKPLPF